MAEEYASKAQGTATTTLSAITTGLLALGNGNGLQGILGGGSNASTLALAQKDAELAQVKSEYAMTEKLNANIVETFKALRDADKAQDAKVNELALQLAGVNASQSALQTQVNFIQGCMSQVIVPRVPNSVLCPGYGTASVYPPVAPTTSTANTNTQGG